jgi:hypothetical protein
MSSEVQRIFSEHPRVSTTKWWLHVGYFPILAKKDLLSGSDIQPALAYTNISRFRGCGAAVGLETRIGDGEYQAFIPVGNFALEFDDISEGPDVTKDSITNALTSVHSVSTTTSSERLGSSVVLKVSSFRLIFVSFTYRMFVLTSKQRALFPYTFSLLRFQ